MQAYKLNKVVQSEDRPLEIAYFLLREGRVMQLVLSVRHSTLSINPSHLNSSSLLIGLGS